jgi:hypothetical protein
VGKTYFWHKFKGQLTDKKVAYVSLFGKETISSIRTMLINFHHSLSFDKDTHSLFCNWVKNTSKLGKSNCASLCFCPHIGSGK